MVISRELMLTWWSETAASIGEEVVSCSASREAEDSLAVTMREVVDS